MFEQLEWIDEVTYLDTTSENYNSLVLKGYLKNYCFDTIEIGLFQSSLSSGTIHWYFHDESSSDFRQMSIDKYHVLPPDDSVYVSIIDLDESYVDKVDSIMIQLGIKVKNHSKNKMVQIQGLDIARSE